MTLVSEDDGANESVAHRVAGLAHAEVEEHGLGGHLLGARAHGIPTRLVEYHAYLVHLYKSIKGHPLYRTREVSLCYF